jgi:hypothetical protein
VINDHLLNFSFYPNLTILLLFSKRDIGLCFGMSLIRYIVFNLNTVPFLPKRFLIRIQLQSLVKPTFVNFWERCLILNNLNTFSND